MGEGARRHRKHRRLASIAGAVAVVASLASLAPGTPAGADVPPGFATTVTQRELVQPTSLAFAPDGRLFVAEQRGTIQTYEGAGDPTPTLFADLRTVVHAHRDRGLLAVEVDPRWPDRPYVYALLSYDAPVGGEAPTYGAAEQDSDPCQVIAPPSTFSSPDGGCPGQTRVARVTADATPAMTAVDWLLTDVCREFPFHDGGGLRFGVDGSLYVALGEGSWPNTDYGQHGVAPDPCGDPALEGGSMRSQDARTPEDALGFSGSILRLDPDGQAPPQQLAYGLRNPFRMAVRPDGALVVGDVGQGSAEEVDVLDPTGPVRNFGWPCYEGAEVRPEFSQLPVCQGLYAEGSAEGPEEMWCHTGTPPDCQSGSGAISGVAIGPTGDLFVADYTREVIMVRRAGADGLEPWATGVGGLVELRAVGADLYSVDVFEGTVVRIYPGVAGSPPVDPRPTAAIATPTARTKVFIGRQLNFSGSATDETGAPLPPSALRWTLVVLHCSDEETCHRHFVESKVGVASGSFTVPEHEAPYKLEVMLRATGAIASDQTSVVLAQQPAKK